MQILRLKAILKLTGLSRSSIYKLMSEDKFPRPIKLSARAVGWKQAVIFEWINERSIVNRQHCKHKPGSHTQGVRS